VFFLGKPIASDKLRLNDMTNPACDKHGIDIKELLHKNRTIVHGTR
jgi:hypothetical protein